jgi:elongation factor G
MAVETAAVVVNAASNIEPTTQRMMDFARDRELCRLIIVNRIDARDARCEQLLAEIKETFGRECLPLNLPSEGATRRRRLLFSAWQCQA